MLYNQLLEPISTEATVGTLRLSTPPYTPHDLQSSIKNSFPHPFCPPGRGQNRLWSKSPATFYKIEYCPVIRFVPWNGVRIC